MRRTSNMNLVNEFINKYSSGFPPKSMSVSQTTSGKQNVIVTGTTGSLGYYLLVSLLGNSQIETIYCLNRSATAQTKFENQHQGRQNSVSIQPGKLKFLKVAFGDELFGLADEEYHELVQEIDIILHNAWKVNWAHELKAFEPHIRGMHTFISLSISSSRRPSIYFVSSVGSTNMFPPNNTVPERVLSDPIHAVEMGYAQSKFVVENILNRVSLDYQLNTNVLRVGQISGPISDESGMWNASEWFPAIMKTSKNMGLVPETLGNSLEVNWIPVDSVASSITEIINFTSNPSFKPTQPTQPSPGAAVFNLVNPIEVTYKSLAPSIQSYFGTQTRMVPFSEWMDNLLKVDKSEIGALQKYPALRIPGLFQKIKKTGVGYDVERALEASRTMRFLKPIDGDMTRIWLRQWKL